MDKRARFALLYSAIALVIVLVLYSTISIYTASASHIVNTSAGGISYNVNEDVGFIYNITINNTDVGQGANITQVNITLPTGFLFIPTYITTSNGTNAAGTFNNNSATNQVLNWINSTAGSHLIAANSSKNFWFNATAATPGTYNIIVKTLNATGTFTSNISVTVNDTTFPSVSVLYPTNALNLSASSISFNISATDNIGISACLYTLNLGATNYTMTANASNTGFNSTNSSIADGTYTAKFYCNDTTNNLNNTAQVTFTIDITAPQVTINLPASTGYTTSIPFNFTLNENGYCKYSLDSGVTNYTMQNNGNRDFNATNISIAEGYYTVTAYCNDSVGNKNYTTTRIFSKDATVPSSIAFGGLTPSNNSIVISSVGSIAGNITATDNINISTLVVRLYNSTGSQVNSGTNSSKVVSSYLLFNFTGHAAGTYYINATVNDTANSVNSTETRKIYLVNSTFVFNGTAKDENGNALNNSNISITIRNQQDWNVVGYSSTTSNASGWFSLNIPSYSLWIYQPLITHRNSTTDASDFISKTIPGFPSQMMTMLAGTTFYLTPAGTINITAINSSSDRVPFQYQIKDTKLGYPIAEEHQNYVTEAVVYVPRNRNYSIMIYPYQSMPVSFNWNNFSSSLSYNLTSNNISTYYATTSTLHKQFNTSMTMARVSGYVNVSGVSGFESGNFTIIPYLLEPGNMIHSEYGDMPYNMGGSNPTMGNDSYNVASMTFSLSLPATAETSNILLFAAVRNGSNYYGGFKNISLIYGSGNVSLNFTSSMMYGLLGSASSIVMDRMDGAGQNISIPTAKQTFNLVNASNLSLTQTQAHLETTVDYSSYGALEFTWMSDVQQSQATANFAISLLSITGIKEMNAFVSGGPSGGNAQYAPRRVSTTTAAQIAANNNITIKTFNPQPIEGTLGASSISIFLLTSNATCDVPSPPSSCYLGGTSQTMANFNPMQAVMGGGKVSFRMGYSGILIHYVNVDMLASGPPDALFENDAGTSESSSTFSNAVKFGSQGPTIYEHVLISMPYTPGSSSITGLNESAPVTMFIPLFYDDNWNVIWNTATNGTIMASFAGNYSHYSAAQAEWGNLTTSKTCTTSSITSSSQLNSTNPCYIDTTYDRIWVRLPHFSGTGPTVTGSLITAASTTPGGGSSSGGTTTPGNKTSIQSWTKITPGAATIWKLDDPVLGLKQISITVNNPAQEVKITIIKYDGLPANVTKAKSGKVYRYLQIEEKNLAKNLSKAIITTQVGKSWLTNNSLTKDKMALFKFDSASSEWKELTTAYKEEDADNYYYDTEVTSFSYFAIAEKATAPLVTPPTTPSAEPAPTTPTTATTPLIGKTTAAIIIGAIIAVIIVALVYFFYKKKKKY